MALIKNLTNLFELHTDDVLAHQYNIFVMLDRDGIHHPRKQFMISKWEIRKVLPDYSGSNICFGYDLGPIDLGLTNMHIYETEFPKYVSIPTMLMYKWKNTADLKDVYLKKEIVIDLINTFKIHRDLYQLGKKTYDNLDHLL